jgi:hypothetical protein
MTAAVRVAFVRERYWCSVTAMGLARAGGLWMAQTATGVRGERRWVVLCEDGRHSTLGRYTNPSEGEIVAAERALVAQALSGWLAVAEGDYWSRRANLTLFMVRRLGSPRVAFETAAVNFERLRRRSVESA